MIKTVTLLLAVLCTSGVLFQAPASADTPAGNKKVVLYGAKWCGYCNQAKAYLSSRKIQFEEIDVDTSQGKSAFARVTGAPLVPENQRVSGIPLLVMGDVKQRGFSAGLYDELFAKNR